MTQITNKDDLLDLLFSTIRDGNANEDGSEQIAEACLSAIEQSGCTICPNEPTEQQLFKADRSGGGFASLEKIRRVYSVMLSSSPFNTQGDEVSCNLPEQAENQGSASLPSDKSGDDREAE